MNYTQKKIKVDAVLCKCLFCLLLKSITSGKSKNSVKYFNLIPVWSEWFQSPRLVFLYTNHRSGQLFSCKRLERNYMEFSFGDWLYLSPHLPVSHNAVVKRSNTDHKSVTSHVRATHTIILPKPLCTRVLRSPCHYPWGHTWVLREGWTSQYSGKWTESADSEPALVENLKSSLVLREFLVYLGLRLPRTWVRAVRTYRQMLLGSSSENTHCEFVSWSPGSAV